MRVGSFESTFLRAAYLASALACGEDEPERVTPTPKMEMAPATPSALEPSADAGRGPPPTLVPNEVPRNVPPLSCGGLLGGSSCDPVTAWPCDVGAGQVCELSNLAGAFRCFEVPEGSPFCGPCDRSTVFCGPGMTCGADTCERYCCQDSDCETGPCLRGVYGDRGVSVVGICAQESAAACGSVVGDIVTGRLADIPDAGASPP